MNDIIHEELGIHPYTVSFQGYRVRETKTGIDKRENKILKAKELCKIYEESMNNLLDSISGEKDTNETIKDLTIKMNKLNSIVNAELTNKIKETKEYQDYENITKQILQEQNRYAQETLNSGGYSIIYDNDQTIRELRNKKNILLNAKWEKEYKIKEELLNNHPEIIGQEEIIKLNSLRKIKNNLWNKSHGIDGIIGDTLDYMGVSNYSSYSTRGHGSNYFNERKSSGYVKEIFANMFDCYLEKDNSQWKAVKKMFPKTCDMFEKIIKKFGVKE